MNKKVFVFVIVGFLLILSLALGLSYASYLVDKTQSNNNEITFGCFNLDVTQQTNPLTSELYNINLVNSFPMSDAQGTSKTPYVVTVTNNCTTNTYDTETVIAINVLKTNTISENYVRVATQLGNNQISDSKILGSITNLSDIEANDTETDKSYIIRTTEVSNGSPQTFKVWLWIDNDAPNSVQGKIFDAKVKIYTRVIDDKFNNSANEPELYSGLIPVIYDDNGNTIYADTAKDWYSYENKKWANAVLVDDTIINNYYSNGNLIARTGSNADNIIPSEHILQYYVWVPRYAYKLFNTENGGSINNLNVDIKFQRRTDEKLLGDTNGAYLTHPAFTFGTNELSGIWVGKFETSSTELTSGYGTENNLNCTSSTCAASSILRIIPNVNPVRYNTLAQYFYAAQSISKTGNIFGLSNSEVDTHVMKNSEWGAVAYLAASNYGGLTSETANVINSYISSNTFKTGMSCYSGSCYAFNAESANRASTTNNLYGVFDMAGGAWEYTMGNVCNGVKNYSYQVGGSGLVNPGSKYYDSYVNYEDSYLIQKNGLLGDATKEIMATYGSDSGAIYGNFSSFPFTTDNWFIRGGYYNSGVKSGIMAYADYDGSAGAAFTFRTVLVSDLDI